MNRYVCCIALLCFQFIFCDGLFAAPLTLDIIDFRSENKEEIVHAILEIQESLLFPIEATEYPAFAENGFLTIRMTPEYLYDFISTDRIIVGYCGNEMTGYLLLGSIEGYLDWARGKRFDSAWNLYSLGSAQYIDQIGVATSCSQQGVGTALVNCAKMLSPGGLVTDILLEPHHNKASTAFFIKKGFTNIGIMHVEANAIRPAHKTLVMYWEGN